MIKRQKNACSHHIETSILICRANQFTGFLYDGNIGCQSFDKVWEKEKKREPKNTILKTTNFLHNKH